MKESLLQFIWQYQYFNSRDLRTTAGEAVQVLSPGQLNAHQGPDFLDARLRIGGTSWVGAVELHVKASDWGRHAHTTDKNYRNVILHVVWENDAAEQWMEVRSGERNIPTLVLEHRVPKWLLDRYAAWMRDQGFVACQRQLGAVPEDLWQAWKQRFGRRETTPASPRYRCAPCRQSPALGRNLLVADGAYFWRTRQRSSF